MDDSREHIAKLIKQISDREKDLKSLISPQLESLVAERASQHKYIEEIRRALTPSSDFLLSIRDQKNMISKYAIEVRQAHVWSGVGPRQLIDIEKVIADFSP